MNITDLNGKKICILGFGKEGKTMVEALEKYAPDCEITIADQNEKIFDEPPATSHQPPANKHWLQLGTGWLQNLDKFDVIIKSPGIPPSRLLTTHYKLLTTPTQIFFDSIADSGVTVIGVTGSKGKSTTASLIHSILKAGGRKPVAGSILVGNIGEPAISHIADAKKGTIFVMEMSSYQLMDLKSSPHIAVVTSFFPEHMDYHGSEAAYLEAKKNITRFQGDDDIVFFCATSHGAADIAKEGNGRKIPFSGDESPVAIEKTHLIGAHNQSNIAGAFAVARHLGIDESDAIAAIKEFRGLPHRLQSLGVHHGVEWIDDAISTTPESTIAALDALGDRVQTIILGGQDRGYDFTELGKRITTSKIETVILFPGSGQKIKEAIEKATKTVKFVEAGSMEKAVIAAKQATSQPANQQHRIVLLSTASPSYGMFKNFEEKGDLFKKEVQRI